MGDVLKFPARPEQAEAEDADSPAGGDAAMGAGLESGEATPVQPKPPRKIFWIRSAQALVLAAAVYFSVGATNNSGSRMNDLSHRLMCQCGCAQLLGECDHYGCPSRDKELGELRADIAAGMSDQQILKAFAAQYGAVVLAAPETHGFDLVAWIAPFAVFAAALLGTILLIRRWGGLRGFKAQPAADADLAALDPAERERRERIRRETEIDGGRDGGLKP